MSSPFDETHPATERAGLAPLPDPPLRASKQPTKTRICRQKSKTGCSTCKSRRVKCDEARPACMKCTQFGRRCDGYNYRAKPKPAWLQGITLITGTSGLSRVNAPTPLSLSPSISTFVVPNQREHACFQLFKTKIIHELAGGQESKLWHEIVLQACNTHDAARFAAIALAALSNSAHTSFIKSEADYSVQDYSEERAACKNFAIKQLGQAITGLRALVSKGNGAVRTSLIVSLLIYCFENAIGAPQQAGIYIHNAIKIMYGHPAMRSHPGHNCLVSSPAPEVFEDEIVTTYARLALNLTTRSESHDSLRANFLDLIMVDSPMPQMPRAFRTIAEAEEHLGYVLYETLPKRPQSPEATPPRRPSADDQHVAAQTNDFSVQSPRKRPPTIFTTGLDNSSFNQRFQQWEGALSPIFNHARGSEDSPDLLPAIILRIKALNVSLIGQGVFLPNNNPYTFLPSFLEVLKLCHQLLDFPDFLRTFVFDFGVIPSLFTIIYTSLDPRLREEAVSILEEMTPRCEGTWSAARVAAMGEVHSGSMISEPYAQELRHFIPPSPYTSGSDKSMLESPPLTWPQSAVCSRPLWQQDWGTRSAGG